MIVGYPVRQGKTQATTANNRIDKVSELIYQSTKTWKVDSFKSPFTPMEVHVICIPLSIYTSEDKMVWRANNSGNDFGEIATTTAWTLWQARNKHIMEGKRQSVEDICSIIFSIIREMRELRDKILAQVIVMNSTWKPSQEPSVKVNFDAVFKTILHQSYSDFVIRNSRGLVMGSRTVFNKFVSNSFIVEAIACLQALNFSQETIGFTHVQMKGHGESFYLIRKTQGSKDLSLGWDISLKALSRRVVFGGSPWLREPGFDWGIITGASRGGLSLGWKNEVDIRLMGYNDNCVDVIVTNDSNRPE
ncbi:hypothetical protein J1N35_008667 [Gossypium stocksii]|uniref:RNase H type-1 domain-containing protein n=1 Tax=Gossypium stocksii TaxID=47602 RepID=A0A9D4AGC8_9ROSI|nr:hypothetical protein J1N35_008667 [Gossypium stocksii]